MEYIERLEQLLNELEDNSDKLSNLPKLVSGIKELVALYQAGEEELKKTGASLAAIEMELNEKLVALQNLLKVEQESKEELLNTVRSVLTANNKEQLDAVNSITSVLGNKLTIAESNLTVKAVEIDGVVKRIELKAGEIDDVAKRIEQKASENGEKLAGITQEVSVVESKVCSYGDSAASDLKELKELIPIIKRTQIFAGVTAVLALVACVLAVVM